LAAKGIKTRQSYALLGDFRKWSEGYTQAERSKMASGLTPTSAIAGKEQVAQLVMEGATPREQELIAKGKLKDILREREARQALVSDILEKYVQPEDGESFAEYLQRARNYLSGSIDLSLKSAYGGARYGVGGTTLREPPSLESYMAFSLEGKFLQPEDQEKLSSRYNFGNAKLNTLKYNPKMKKFVAGYKKPSSRPETSNTSNETNDGEFYFT